MQTARMAAIATALTCTGWQPHWSVPCPSGAAARFCPDVAVTLMSFE
jgi:hypothetical protein